MNINPDRITGLVLAGGRGSRMGHVDKGLQPLRGAPMVQHVIDRLAPQVGALMINANQNINRYADFALPVCPDQITDFAGPLAGLQAGLIGCTTEFLATAPCDSPFLPQNLVVRLADALVLGKADIAVAVTSEGDARQVHPVFCLMKTALLPHLNQFLDRGGRKIGAWHALLNTTQVQFSDEQAFSNINTLEDLRNFETS